MRIELNSVGGWASRAALVAAALWLGACSPKTPVQPATPAPATPAPTPEATPVPTPAPPYVPSKRLETGKIFNGMRYKVTLETEFGTTATNERNDPDSYTAELHVTVKVPKPHRDLAEITKLNAQLPKLLPTLPALLESAKVSPYFDELYRLKVAHLRANMNRLDNLLTRHNFYDTETVLEFQNPASKRRALFVQADMDVDEDGSDSDRVPEVDGSSVTFQPFTSYKWPKKTETPNTFIPYREGKLKGYAKELSQSGVSAARTQELKEAVTRVKSEVADLKRYSYLVASTDPFVVMPGSMCGKGSGGYSAAVGDYCVVIYGSVLYPAIVGDVGPSYKSGEASLRLCKQLNAQANTMNRPVNDLKVSYLVFPGSGEKPWDVPNLEHWRERCGKLLEELGGFDGELYAWENLIKPKPTPEVTPPPAATPPTTPPVVPPATPAPTAPVAAKSTP